MHQFSPSLHWIILLLACFVAASAIDLLEEGKTVIIQRDVEHVLIRKDLSFTANELRKMNKQILLAKRSLAGNTLDTAKNLNLKAFFKILDFLRKETELREVSFNSLFDTNTHQREKSKRGLEILGELMSAVTGVLYLGAFIYTSLAWTTTTRPLRHSLVGFNHSKLMLKPCWKYLTSNLLSTLNCLKPTKSSLLLRTSCKKVDMTESVKWQLM